MNKQLDNETRDARMISLVKDIDDLCRKHLDLGNIPEYKRDFRPEVRSLVHKYELYIDRIIRFEGGYTIFIEKGGWEIMRIEDGEVKEKATFAAWEGMQGNYVHIVFFETFYCVFHNWRGCSYGDYSEPYVCAHGYRDLKSKIKITKDEAKVPGIGSAIRDVGFNNRDIVYDRTFGLFYNALKQKGFDLECTYGGENKPSGEPLPSCLIYPEYYCDKEDDDEEYWLF